MNVTNDEPSEDGEQPDSQLDRAYIDWLEKRQAGIEPDLDEYRAVLADTEWREFEKLIRTAKRLRKALGPDEPLPDETISSDDLDERFELGERIGMGGMGIVFAALQTLGDKKRKVAIKFLRPSLRDREAEHTRFLREAHTTNSVIQPGVIPIFSFLKNRSRLPGYAMQLIAAPRTLSDVMKAYHTTPPGESRSTQLSDQVRYLETVARVAHIAHSQQRVCHLDIKPKNVVIDGSDNAYLIDWGSARIFDGPGADTGPLAFWSHGYVAPELKTGGAPNPRCDVYSLGAILGAVLYGIADGGAPAGRKHLEKALRPLQAIEEKSTNQSPDERYASAQEFADELARYREHSDVRAYRAPIGDRAWKWISRHRGVSSLAAMLFAIITVTALVIAGQQRRLFENARTIAKNRANLLSHQADKISLLEQGAARRVEELMAHYAEQLARGRSGEPVRLATQAVNQLTEELARRLAADDPLLVSARATAIALERNALLHQPDTLKKERRELLDKAIGVLTMLANDHPDNRDYQLGLGDCYTRKGVEILGDATDSAKRREAIGFLYTGRRHLEPLLGEKSSFNKLGRYWMSSSWHAEATAHLSAERFSEALFALDRSYEYSDDPRANLSRLATELVRMHAEEEQTKLPWSRGPTVDHGKATRLADHLARRKGTSARTVYNAACAFSLASTDPLATQAAREDRARRALELLRQLVERGYFRSPEALKELWEDPDLEPIRWRPEFQALLKELHDRADSPNLP